MNMKLGVKRQGEQEAEHQGEQSRGQERTLRSGLEP